MTENKIKYNSYENSFYINDDEGISQIIAPELIIEIINDYEKEIDKFKKENEQLKERIKRHMEIELLKSEDYANCHNCKHNRSVHDGATLDGMCSIKGLMNLGGYFDTEYHNLPNRTICPCWELGE